MADSEELLENQNTTVIEDAGEDGKSSSSSSPPPPQKKQKLEMEEDEEENDDDRYYYSDDDDEMMLTYKDLSDEQWAELELDYCPEGSEEYDADEWSIYLRQIREELSNFHIYHHGGRCSVAEDDSLNFNIPPVKTMIDCSYAATHFFNEAHQKNYKLEKILKINRELWGAAGDRHYITFQAKDSVTNSLDTFQAVVWEGLEKVNPIPMIVEFCRIKPAVATS